MPKDINESFITYYNERAPEYDDIYLGKTMGTLDPRLYKVDIKKIGDLCSQFGYGRTIDIGCGTGFWLSYYAKNCERIILIDKSENMLSECGARVDNLGLRDKCDYIWGDFYEYDFTNNLFDSCFVGFFISHLSLEAEQAFFNKVRKILKPNAQFMLIDSAWSESRKKYRQKEGLQERVLKDGRKFTIYKKYFDKYDIENILKRYDFRIETIYFGDVFFAVRGSA